MSTADFALLSDRLVVFATIVYAVALVAHVAEWAAARQPAAQAAQPRQPERELVGAAATGHAQPDTRSMERTPAAGSASGPGDRSDVFGRVGLSVTVLAFALHLAGVVCRGLAAGRAPWGNMYEFATTGTAAVVAAYLLLVRRYRLRWLGGLVTGFVTVVLGLAVLELYVPAGPLVPALHSYWLLIHVFAAAIAGGGYTIGALATVLYLLRSRAERVTPVEERGRGYLWRLPSAASIDRVAYRVHCFAFPLWTFAVLAGAIWADYAWGRYWGWDPKETWAFITWVVYAAYLHARATSGWRGKAAAVIALVGFATFLFNFVGINLFGSGLHSYSGL